MRISGALIGHVILFCIIVFFSFQLLTQDPPWVLLDAFNLVIHEAGHVVFMPFGEFIEILGGSLLQTFIPIAFVFNFLFKEDYIGTFFSIFWLGDSVINVATYMADARVRQLPLIADGLIHDWNWLFTEMGILSKAEVVGSVFFYCGAFFLIISIAGITITIGVESGLIKRRLKP